ncbi:MAG: trypsin-like peptidase domain-containing protein [Planctomycetota bacterium]|nr:trypsin-like peptidase domain-containing protein [Planctomycetota bacterium]
MSLAPFAIAALQLISTASQSPEQAAQDYDRRVTPEVLVVRSTAPSVVYIETDVKQVVRTWLGDTERMAQSSGSGAVIFDQGYIVTNYHVVRGANAIRVSFDKTYDDKVYEARLISYVAEEDLALIKIDGPAPFPTVPLGISSDLMIGEKVLAIGNPYGQTNTVSSGIISGLHRELDIPAENLSFTNLIQTDASINPGNSGGPLLNINGDLIGINAAMRTGAENIGFAIPIDRVVQVLEEHLLSTRLAAAWLGFEVDEASLSVTDVIPGSPAANAGVRKGDRILAFGDSRVDAPEDYRLARLAVDPRQSLKLGLGRDAGKLDLDLTPWDMVDGMLYERLGMTVEAIALGRTRLVQVGSLRPGGPADTLGLEPGDILDTIQPTGRRATIVREPRHLAMTVQGLEPGTRLAMNVWRDLNENGRLERTQNPPYSELFEGELAIE